MRTNQEWTTGTSSRSSLVRVVWCRATIGSSSLLSNANALPGGPPRVRAGVPKRGVFERVDEDGGRE